MADLYGLIFDVDGVIADTEPLNARVTIRVLKDRFGLEGVSAEDFAGGSAGEPRRTSRPAPGPTV